MEQRCHGPFGPHLHPTTNDLLPDALGTSSETAGTRYWYGEHDNVRYNASNNWGDGGLEVGEALRGGIGLCSTDDLEDWRFEGIMLHYANVSDMVLGRDPDGGMVLQQPKVKMKGIRQPGILVRLRLISFAFRECAL